MRLQMVGCSHHHASVELRERLAFTPEAAREALHQLRDRFPDAEAVLLSTCNRVELYVASEHSEACPSHSDVVHFLADFHKLNADDIFDDLFERTGEDFVRHLFTVAASLDSMVVGEAQIIAQVKQAYDLATRENSVGPITNSAFQAALRVAKRIATETAIQQKRLSVPSVAVAEYARQFFERFDDKRVLVIGAGEMAEETLRYLVDEGVRDVTIVNRTLSRAADLAAKMVGKAEPWETLGHHISEADLIVSATGATEPIITSESFHSLHAKRFQRPLLILDMAVPRDFEATVADYVGVYLYGVDDLKAACERNRQEREREWPKAEKIIEDETVRFMKDLHHRATGPTIKRLRERADEIKLDEMTRLYNKLGEMDPKAKAEITKSFDRLINKLLHPPLESLRDEAQYGSPHGLLAALKRLFKLSD